MTEETTGHAAAPWCFILYKAGNKETMVRAEATLRRICERYVKNRYKILVKDVRDTDTELPPDLLVVPTVVRVTPPPERRVVGDFSQVEKAAEWLGLTNAEEVEG